MAHGRYDLRSVARNRALESRGGRTRDYSGRWRFTYYPVRNRTDRLRIARYTDETPVPFVRRHFNRKALSSGSQGARKGPRSEIYFQCSCPPDADGKHCNERNEACQHCIACFINHRDEDAIGFAQVTAAMTVIDLRIYHEITITPRARGNAPAKPSFTVRELCKGKGKECEHCKEKHPTAYGGKRLWFMSGGALDNLALYTDTLEKTCMRCGKETIINSLECAGCGEELVPCDEVTVMGEQTLGDTRNSQIVCAKCGVKAVPTTVFSCEGECENPRPGESWMIDSLVTKIADVEDGKEVSGTSQFSFQASGGWSKIEKRYQDLNVIPLTDEEIAEHVAPLSIAKQLKVLGLQKGQIPQGFEGEPEDTESYDDSGIGEEGEGDTPRPHIPTKRIGA